MNNDDVAAVHDLLAAARSADGRPPLSDHLYLDLVSRDSDRFAGFVIRSSGEDGLAGYAQLSRSNKSEAFEVVIHPNHREQSSALVPGLLSVALNTAAERCVGVVNWWIFEPTDDDHLVATNAGMQHDRTLFQMHRSLPTGIDVAIETRPITAADDEAWLTVNNRAFAQHGEQGGWTLETLRQRRAEEWFDPEGFLLHERDDEVAGFCWTKVHGSGADRVGEIYVIAVDPKFHGAGLGKQLTLAGLKHLANLGVTSAMLYVDAHNTAAVGLYEQLGFTVTTTTVGYVLDLTATDSAKSKT
jgi:mycothiol synthase